jgi:hypothetical protein
MEGAIIKVIHGSFENQYIVYFASEKKSYTVPESELQAA